MAVVFAATTLICGIGWFTRYVSCAALIYYMNEKGYIPPTEKEIEVSVRFIIARILKL